jgi:poly(3-hydroxybutyrate) depolymerase
VIERTIATQTHGRYLVVPPVSPGPAPVLLGFHGYAEAAETQLERLRAIKGAERWLLVSIQGMHRFYQRRTHWTPSLASGPPRRVWCSRAFRRASR